MKLCICACAYVHMRIAMYKYKNFAHFIYVHSTHNSEINNGISDYPHCIRMYKQHTLYVPFSNVHGGTLGPRHM